MDGLSISTGQNLLKTGKTVSELRANEFGPQSSDTSEKASFQDTLTKAIGSVNEAQKKADVLMQKLATGESKNIPEVMIAVEKAGIAMKLMTQVRSKIIDAYQEVMKMQL